MLNCIFPGCSLSRIFKSALCDRHQGCRVPKKLFPNCLFPGCLHPVHAIGHCDGHGQQIRNGKELCLLQEAHEKCTFPGCDNPHDAKGLCSTHYSQWQDGKELRPVRYSPSPIREISDGVCAVVLYGTDENGRLGAITGVCRISKADEGNVSAHRWREHNTGYACTKIDGVRIFMHRLLLSPPEGMQIDHVDGDRLNNQRGNLRIVTQNENRQNIPVRRNSGTGHRGVHFDEKKQLYRTRVTGPDGKCQGHRHKNIEDAIAEAQLLRSQLMTHVNEDRSSRK